MGTKTRAMMERVGLVSSPFENPEVAAMELIAEILRKLPDDDARLRVMRWSFGRFNPEFKRPLPEETTPVPAPAEAPAVAANVAPDMTTEIAAVAPEMATPPPPRRIDVGDFGSQLSELSDFFLPDPRRRSTASDGPPVNLDAF